MKTKLSFWQIWNMNFGFLGLQFSFALQQTNMSPIYRYLGADENVAILWLAGPLTGLLVQPFIGAWSDNTWSKKWGRRKPFFLVGALLASVGLLAMPFSSALWMAVSLLWILDAANNIALEPYRAFVADKLPQEQHSFGFLFQSFFTGLGSTLANFTPAIIITLGLVAKDAVASNGIPITVYWAFIIGAITSVVTIGITLFTTKEIAPTPEDILRIEKNKSGKNLFQMVTHEISEAFKTMPRIMKLLIPVKFFTWYGMFCYWQSITDGLALSLFNTKDPTSTLYKSAGVLTGEINGSYNIVCFLSAFLLVPLARKLGANVTHTVCLLFGGIALVLMPHYSNSIALFSIPNIFGEGKIVISQIYFISLGLGLAWASMMSMPYTILTRAIPSTKIGIYMGIFNMFIVIPMLIQTLTMDFIMKHFLHNNKIYEVVFAGVFLMIGGVFSLFVREKNPDYLI